MSLEQLPFRGATGAQPAEAEGAAEPTWPWGVPVQREAGRPAPAADRHPQRRSWGTGVVRAPSALYPKGGRGRKGQSRDGPRGETALFARPLPPTFTRPAGTLFWGLALAFLRKGYEGGGEGQRKGCPLVRPPPQAWPKGSRQDTKVRRPPAWAAALCPVGLGRSCLCPISCRSAGALGAAGGLNTTESSPNPATAPAPISPWPRSLGARGSPRTGLGVSFQGVCRESWEVAGGAVLPPAAQLLAPWRAWLPFQPRACSQQGPGRGEGERLLAADTAASRSGPTSELFNSWLSRQEETQTWRSNALGWAETADSRCPALGRGGQGVRVPTGRFLLTSWCWELGAGWTDSCERVSPCGHRGACSKGLCCRGGGPRTALLFLALAPPVRKRCPRREE